MSSKLLRWGIVSVGKVSHDFCVALASVSKCHSIAAVAARDKERAEKFARKFEIPKHYNSYKELARSPDIDVAYVGTINPQHYDVVMMLLGYGKNVLCEKPMGMNVDQVKEMVDCAQKNCVFLMEGIWSRFLPSYEHLRWKLNEDCLGQIKEVNVQFGLPILDVERVTQKKLGGGVLLDMGPYAISLFQMVFEEPPCKIEACADLNKEGVDIHVEATLHYEDSRKATMVLSAKEMLANTAIIKGANGCITMDKFWCCNKLTDEDGEEWEWPMEPGRFPTNFPNAEGFLHEANAVRESIFDGQKENKIMPLEESILINEILTQIRQSVGVKYNVDKFPVPIEES